MSIRRQERSARRLETFIRNEYIRSGEKFSPIDSNLTPRQRRKIDALNGRLESPNIRVGEAAVAAAQVADKSLRKAERLSIVNLAGIMASMVLYSKFGIVNVAELMVPRMGNNVDVALGITAATITPNALMYFAHVKLDAMIKTAERPVQAHAISKFNSVMNIQDGDTIHCIGLPIVQSALAEQIASVADGGIETTPPLGEYFAIAAESYSELANSYGIRTNINSQAHP